MSLLALAQSAFAQTTVTLMQDLNGYTGTTDSWLWAASPNTNREGDGLPLRTETQDSAVIRFAIFESEGGPIPNGSTIHSATLSLYKWNGPEGVFKASRLLKSFNESQVTWNNAATGTSWTTPGANSASNDYLATADGQASVGDAAANGCGSAPYPAACWLNIDVTSGVQAFGSGTANYGWKLALVSSSDPNYKAFDDSENQSFPTLRPKLTITYTVPTGSTATLMEGQNGYVGTTDSWLWAASPNTNKNGEGLPLRTETQDSAVIRFAIFESEGGLIPNGSTIHSATLSLYKWNGPDGVFKASRLLKSFNQSQVTWNVAATGTAWTTPGANSAGNDYLATADGQASVGDAAANGCGSAPYPAACWLNINVTSGVQAFGSGTANYGWKLALVSSSNPNYKAFDDSENQSFPTLRPKLTVNYTPPDTCAVPTANFTWNQNPAGSLNVTFNASSSADGSYPITSLRLQFGDGQEVTWNDKNQPQSHSYAAYTTYNATLTATNQCGTSAPKTLPVTPTPGGVPTASFTWSQNPGSLNVTFNASGSADGAAPITSLRLRFGHGSPEEEHTWDDKTSPQTHAFPAPGAYSVKLTATNTHGTSPVYQQQIQVTDPNTTVYPSPLPASGIAVPTFHSMSLYYNGTYSTSNPPPGQKVYVRYRKATDNPATPGVWKEAYPMWYDVRTSNPGCTIAACGLPYTWRGRGSVVHLQPATQYVFEVATGNDYASADWAAGNQIQDPNAADPRFPSTWSEQFAEQAPQPITPRNPADGPLVIAQGGSAATGYKVYDGWNGSSKNVIDRTGHGLDAGPDPSDPHDDMDEPHLGTCLLCYKDPSFGIVVKASYVIVRRVKVQGAAAAGIIIYPNVTNVVIEDTEVTDWSRRPGTTADYEPTNPNSWGTWGMNEAGGIHLSGNNSRIVVQRNVIKNPHYGAFPWDLDSTCRAANHPVGPIGITTLHGGQQNVFRYNEITSDPNNKNKWFMDGISGDKNFSAKGAPGADSDIYQNIIMQVFDDAIEAEGGGRNVRVWGNYVSDIMVAVATSTVHFGPTYVWRNVANRQRVCHDGVTDTDSETANPVAFKAGGRNGERPGEDFGDGMRYFFHNTLLQQPIGNVPDGAGTGFDGIFNGSGSVRFTQAHNNILHVRTSNNYAVMALNSPEGSAFTFNVTNGKHDSDIPALDPDFKFSGTEPNYVSGHGWQSVPQLGGGGQGNYQLASGKGRDTWATNRSCIVLPNFNDGYIGSAPDCGAHESGTGPMKFGITAGQ